MIRSAERLRYSQFHSFVLRLFCAHQFAIAIAFSLFEIPCALTPVTGQRLIHCRFRTNSDRVPLDPLASGRCEPAGDCPSSGLSERLHKTGRLTPASRQTTEGPSASSGASERLKGPMVRYEGPAAKKPNLIWVMA